MNHEHYKDSTAETAIWRTGRPRKRRRKRRRSDYHLYYEVGEICDFGQVVEAVNRKVLGR